MLQRRNLRQGGSRNAPLINSVLYPPYDEGLGRICRGGFTPRRRIIVDGISACNQAYFSSGFRAVFRVNSPPRGFPAGSGLQDGPGRPSYAIREAENVHAHEEKADPSGRRAGDDGKNAAYCRPRFRDPQAGARPRRKRRRLAGGGILALAIVLIFAFLPAILVHTPLLGIFVRRAARLEGSLAFQSASLGWFSSTSITGIVVRDAQGETVLEADRLTINRSLSRLIFNSANLGTLRIEKPRLGAKLSHDGSNVQTLLARWLNAPAGPSGSGGSTGAGVDLSLEVADGEATIVHQETQQTSALRQSPACRRSGAATSPATRVEGSAAYQGEIAALQPWIDAATHGAGLRLAGSLSGTLAVQQGDGVLTCKSENDIQQLAVTAPSGQSFQDPRVHCAVQCSYQTADGALKLDQSTIQFSGADAYGFQLGPGELKLRFADGSPSRATARRVQPRDAFRRIGASAGRSVDGIPPGGRHAGRPRPAWRGGLPLGVEIRRARARLR